MKFLSISCMYMFQVYSLTIEPFFNSSGSVASLIAANRKWVVSS